MELANNIYSLLRHLNAVFGRQSDQILQRQLGIGIAQYKILIGLQASPVNQQRRLALSLGQTEASISRQIKLLLAKGLLKSQINPLNHREHITSLTPRGNKIMVAAQKVLQEYQTKSLNQITHQDQKRLLYFLSSIQP